MPRSWHCFGFSLSLSSSSIILSRGGTLLPRVDSRPRNLESLSVYKRKKKKNKILIQIDPRFPASIPGADVGLGPEGVHPRWMMMMNGEDGEDDDYYSQPAQQFLRIHPCSFPRLLLSLLLPR